MDASFWDGKRAPGISDQLDLDRFDSLQALIADAVSTHGDKPAFTGMGQVLSFKDIDRLSDQFAAWLQNHTMLEVGDRVAIQMPNVLQYPVAAFGVIKAGMVVVNTNPLYTAREMKHQFNDSGAKALICVNIVGHLVEDILSETGIEHLIVSGLGDLLSWPKRPFINMAVKHLKKMVQPYNLPSALSFREALALGEKSHFQPVKNLSKDQLAVLQYTGGTTGVAKGAMLTHGNLLSNVLQTESMRGQVFADGSPYTRPEGDTVVAPLPLYHIYAFTVHMLSYFSLGANNILIANPRDIDGFIKAIKPYKLDSFIGLNTLFVGLMNHPEFSNLDFSELKITTSGGTALQKATAERWHKITGCRIGEGYGLSETSPIVSVNPAGEFVQDGTVGVAMPHTSVKVINDEGEELAFGEPGELCVQGPQVMAGYWQRPEETLEVLSEDGWFKTGDVAVIRKDGYISIVDRLKDMVLVSGFNVYPNEIEDIVSRHEKVLNCAAIGIPDEKTGEAVKLFVIPQDSSVTEKELKDFCRQQLTAYKVPRKIEFRDELPMTPVGKVLRKDLRAEELKKIQVA